MDEALIVSLRIKWLLIAGGQAAIVADCSSLRSEMGRFAVPAAVRDHTNLRVSWLGGIAAYPLRSAFVLKSAVEFSLVAARLQLGLLVQEAGFHLPAAPRCAGSSSGLSPSVGFVSVDVPERLMPKGRRSTCLSLSVRIRDSGRQI